MKTRSLNRLYRRSIGSSLCSLSILLQDYVRPSFQCMTQRLTLVLLVIPLAFSPLTVLMANQQTSVTPSVEGGVWLVTDTTNQSFTVTFEREGKLKCLSSSGLKGTGSWRQKGNSLYFEVNQKLIEYNGTVTTDKMDGDATYHTKLISKWTAIREEASVITAGIPINYPLIALSARQSGEVIVNMQIDKNGFVTSANAFSGPELLRKFSEMSAKQWLFNSYGNPPEVRLVRVVFAFRVVDLDCRKESPPSAIPVLISQFQIEVKSYSVCISN